MKPSKRLEAMRANPAGDWRIGDVEALCRDYDVRCTPPRGGGSHYGIGHPSLDWKLTIPSRRPIKAVYVRNLVALIDAVRSLD